MRIADWGIKKTNSRFISLRKQRVRGPSPQGTHFHGSRVPSGREALAGIIPSNGKGGGVQWANRIGKREDYRSKW